MTHVHRLRALRDEVELPVGLLTEGDRIGLLGVDEVRELDRVTDEEDAQVVADQVPVAVLGVELDREAARVARRLRGVTPAGDRGEAQGHVGALALLLEELGPRVPGDRLVAPGPVGLEVAVRGWSRVRARPARECARDRSG